MGKGNRTKRDRVAATLAGGSPMKTGSKKQGMPSWAGTAIVVAVLVLLVGVVLFSVLNSRGTFLRMRTVAETENYEITVPMMTYLVYSEYENLTSMYGQYGMSKIPGGEGGSALDTSKSLAEQIYSQTTGADGQVEVVTWLDYFASIAEADAKQILVCCEASTAAGEGLTEADFAKIDAELEAIRSNAKLYGYSMTSYLQMMYGSGILEKDVRAVMELTQLASNWSEKKRAEFNDAVTEDRINAYYDEHKSNYDVYCDYISITFEALFTPSTKENADEKKTENEANRLKYEAEQTKFADRVAKLTDAAVITDMIKFKEMLTDFLYEDELEAAKEKKEGDKTLTSEEEAECLQKARDRVEALIVLNAGQGETENDDLNDWLFQKSGENFVRKSGELKKLETTAPVEVKDSVYSKASSSYTAAFFIKGMHRDESYLHDVGHILFKSETFDGLADTSKLQGKTKELADAVLARDGKLSAEAMSKELLKVLFNEGKITEATAEDGRKYYKIDKGVFEEYGNTYTEDSSVFYEKVYEGQMVAEYENWFLGTQRVEGEISYPEAVKTSYGYHIMFYTGNAVKSWKDSIHSTIVGNDHNSYLTGLQETYQVTITAKNWKYVA